LSSLSANFPEERFALRNMRHGGPLEPTNTPAQKAPTGSGTRQAFVYNIPHVPNAMQVVPLASLHAQRP